MLELKNWDRPGNSAVYIRNLCKRYDNGPPILQNFCMNVQKGSVYGLLGSSGCGKTTVLSCVTGLIKWNSGNLLVFGKEPGSKGSGIPGKRLGYMPQDLALYYQLSIQEIIQLYGKIYNMSNAEIKERWNFLNKLLQLPTTFKQIGDLSGGQKRRASLALAFIHCPELLILDEPTVGLDPLLRSNIWNHLYTLSSTLGTTIILTTHYIEEARLSNKIGIMRKGRLLVEDTPSKLLEYYRCELLEQAVLQLCRKDEEKKDQNTINIYKQENELKFKSSWKSNAISDLVATNEQQHELTNGTFRAWDDNFIISECKTSQHLNNYSVTERSNCDANHGNMYSIRNLKIYRSLQRICGLTKVFLLIFLRYPILLGFLLFIPTIQGSLTLWGIGHKIRELPLGVVNNDLANWTEECNFPRHSAESCVLTALSCKYINQVKKDDLVTLQPFDTEENALTQVKLGQLWGYLLFPSNYSQHTLDRLIAKQFAFEESIDGSRINAHLDYSQSVVSGLIIKNLLNSYHAYIKLLAASCQIGEGQAEIPFTFRKPVFGNNNDDYTTYIMPGVIICSMMFIIGTLTAALFIADNRQGTMSRGRVAGVTTIDIMGSYMLTQGIVIVTQLVIWSGVLHIVFAFEITGSYFLFQALCVLSGLFGAAFGIFVGILCKDMVEAGIVGMFIAPIFMLFGGVFFSTRNMSPICQYLSIILPTTLPTTAVRSVVTRGMGLENSLVWSGFVAVITWIVFLLTCSIIAFKKYCK